MKLITLTILLLLLTSCATHKYVIEYKECSWDEYIATVNMSTADNTIWISTYKQAVPILHIWNSKILNVCSYKLVSKTLIKD
jgi:hypothetical protein